MNRVVMSFALGYSLAVSFLTFLTIYSASFTDWIICLDFNYYGEGVPELILAFLGLIAVLFMSWAVIKAYNEGKFK